MCVCSVVVLKMGNIGPPRAGFEPRTLAFEASVLTNTLPMLPDVIALSIAYPSTWLLAQEVSADYYTHFCGFISLLNGLVS